jgi:hypothetical protein
MKKQNKWLWLLLSVMLGLNACQKEEPPKASCQNCGYVKEFFTNKPIPFAKVEIYEDFNYTRLIETVTADSNGLFTAKTNWVGEYKYVFAYAPGYFPYSIAVGLTNYNPDTKTFYLDQPGYIQVHVKNTNPFDENDEVILDDFPNGIFLRGTDVDTTICCLLGAAYKEYRVRAFVRKNFKDTTNHVKCIVEPNQTITVDVNY